MKTTYKKSNRTYKNEPKTDKFIDKIVENLDSVNAKDWEMYANLDSVFPCNLFTKKRYKGFNVVTLYLDTMIKKFTSAKYATFNSISKAGGKLKKGAKGCVIEFFTFTYKHKETGKFYTLEQVKLMTEAERKNIGKIPCVKNYVVFNSELIENLSEINFDIEEEEPTVNEIFEQENCENFITQIITKGGLKLKFGIEELAYYSPSFDYVKLPERKYFLSTPKYYATLFHEIIHWTGHESRLERDLKGHSDIESYTFEELIAEMGAMLICLQFGISEEFINSLRYLKSWTSKNLVDRETNLRNAFTQSKKAKKFLENL